MTTENDNTRIDILEASKAKGEDRDCTVITVAEIAGVPYEKAHNAMAKAGRRPRRGARVHEMMKALQQLGIKTSPGVSGLHTVRRDLNMADRKKLTVNMIEKNRLFEDGSYIGVTANHVFAIRNGVVRDWCRGSRLYVQWVYKATKMTAKERRELSKTEVDKEKT